MRASCFCVPAAVQEVRGEVVDGGVSAVTSVDSGEEVDPSLLGFAHDLTVEGLFGFDTAVADEERGFSAREFTLSPN